MNTSIREEKPSCFILDAGVFISGVAQQLPGRLITSPLIFSELKSTSAREVAERLEAAGRLEIVAPSENAILEIRRALNRSRDGFVTSAADMELLALAGTYFRKGTPVCLISDDYALQNIAAILKIPFKSYGQKGIQEIWQWEIYCPGCFRVVNHAKKGDYCPDCRIQLKRRPKK